MNVENEVADNGHRMCLLEERVQRRGPGIRDASGKVDIEPMTGFASAEDPTTKKRRPVLSQKTAFWNLAQWPTPPECFVAARTLSPCNLTKPQLQLGLSSFGAHSSDT